MELSLVHPFAPNGTSAFCQARNSEQCFALTRTIPKTNTASPDYPKQSGARGDEALLLTQKLSFASTELGRLLFCFCVHEARVGLSACSLTLQEYLCPPSPSTCPRDISQVRFGSCSIPHASVAANLCTIACLSAAAVLKVSAIGIPTLALHENIQLEFPATRR